jgi:hypothetical protein
MKPSFAFVALFGAIAIQKNTRDLAAPAPKQSTPVL